MTDSRRLTIGTVIAARLRAFCSTISLATGVPIGGFLPQVGIALTNEYKDDFDTNAAFSPAPAALC